MRSTSTACGVIAAVVWSCAPASRESPKVDSSATTTRAGEADYLVGSLWTVDLSDAAVKRLSFEELWRIGRDHRGWPETPPPDATKDAIHQTLLREKYRNFRDDGDLGEDR